MPTFSQISASVAVPLWQMVLLRIGKKATLFIGLSVRNQKFLWFLDKFNFPHLESYMLGLSALHPSSDRSCLCPQQPASLHDHVRSDGIECGNHVLVTLVSQLLGSAQMLQSLPSPLSQLICVKTECGAHLIFIASTWPRPETSIQENMCFVDCWEIMVTTKM